MRHISRVRRFFSPGATRLPVRTARRWQYTIGQELAARTGFRLFHNHLTVNLVSAVFERDSYVWLRMLRSIRRDVLAEGARHAVNLIMTGVLSGTSEHAEAWRTRLVPLAAEGGSVLFVQLTC